MPVYQVTKTYGHELGLSTVFRQHKAVHSHCSKLHGYALAFAITFAATDLDRNGWVVDFGAMDSLKQELRDLFDHTLLVANDDPEREFFEGLSMRGLAKVRVVPATGCEAFAFLVWRIVDLWVRDNINNRTVLVQSVKVSEHGTNSATYSPVAL